MKRIPASFLGGAVFAALMMSVLLPASRAHAGFYDGKQITLIIGTASGGGYDEYIRVLSPFLQKHIPGRPDIIIQNRTGAGGLTAAAHVYHQAPRDGTVIAICPSVILLAEALEPTKVRFDSRKFGWVGTITTLTHVVAVMKTSGISSIEDAKSKQGILGATAATGADFLEAIMINELLGTKFKIVSGYSSGSKEIALAMERGEVDGFANSWDSWKATRSDWVTQNKLNYLLQIGSKARDLPHVPTFSELVKTPREKAAVELLGLIQTAGRSLFVPPDVPSERLAILRQAFDAAMRDPDYLEAMKARNLEVEPRTGPELQADLDRILATKETAAQDILAAIKKAQGATP